jgi:hypothetical protein
MIEFKEVSFSETSLVDSFGSVFSFNDRIYRTIEKKGEQYCIDLIRSDLFKELAAENLIPRTTISEMKIEGCGLILEHEKLIDSKPHEWSFSMFKEAALTILRVNRICNKYGYELKDAHPHNILFRRQNAVFIDIGSISPKINKSAEWSALTEFIETFYIPLLLWKRGELYITRLILENDFYRRVIPNQSIWDSELFTIVKKELTHFELNLPYTKKSFKVHKSIVFPVTIAVRVVNKLYKIITHRKTSIFKITQRYNSIEEQDIQKLFRKSINSKWMDYHNEHISEGISSTPRFERLVEIIQNECAGIETAIDLAGNRGFFSILLSKELGLKKVIMVDYDENAVDSAFHYFKEKTKYSIETLILNFMVPINLDSTSQRLSCDLAVALAVTHHLILDQNFTITAIFDRIRKYCKKYVMIEFMPLGLWGGKEEDPVNTPEWYTVDWFRDNFKKKFTIIHEEQVEKNRIVFLGKID